MPHERYKLNNVISGLKLSSEKWSMFNAAQRREREGMGHLLPYCMNPWRGR